MTCTISRTLIHTALASVLAVGMFTTAQAAQYTYHGQLIDGSEAAEGQYDIQITPFAAGNLAKSLAQPTELLNVEVTAGTFAVELDVPENHYGQTLVQIAVRPSGSSEPYQPMGEPTPIAKADGGCALNWSLDGNAANVTASTFLGIANNSDTPLVFKAKNRVIGTLTPRGTDAEYGDAPSVAFGSSANEATGIGATVSGGGRTKSGAGSDCPNCKNIASGDFSTVGGGYHTVASGFSSTVAGGETHSASGMFSTVGGGSGNSASNSSSTVSGGLNSQASGAYSTVSGGNLNTASDNASTVSGGASNRASGKHSTVGGGEQNSASGLESTVSGGSLNTASRSSSTVSGGDRNTASGSSSTVSGGQNNTASGPSNTVGGGQNNIASSLASTIGGGFLNKTKGDYSTVSGGRGNCAGGNDSWAGGYFASVRPGTLDGGNGCGDAIPNSGDGDGDEGTFVWSDSSTTDLFTSTGPHQFNIRAEGGVGINTAPVDGNVELTIQADASGSNYANIWMKNRNTSNRGILMSVGDGSGTNDAAFYIDQFNAAGGQSRVLTINSAGTTLVQGGAVGTVSDARLKKNITNIEEPLNRLLALRGHVFEYINPEQSMSTPGVHMGFVAQEVMNTEPSWVDTNSDGYHSVRPIGVSALTVEAVRELHDTNTITDQAQDAEITALKLENAQLKTQLNAVLTRLERLEATQADKE